MRFKCFLLLFLIIYGMALSAQVRTITGTVTDETGETLPGVNVVVQGTTTGTTTDVNGTYSIGVPANNNILVFSYIGMITREIQIGNSTVINVTMETETIGMDEVVVVGYGTQKKSDITGTVASVGQERLELVPNLNIAQAIQGAVPGVMMQTSSAGSSPDEVIMIRGRNSIRASNDPLIVVDGIPYGGQLRDINPNDVQSIEVLKDASAAAIYGSRGANGVILVTTKEGLEGKPKISYDGYYSIQQFTDLPDLMNGEEFYNFKMEREPDAMTQSEQEVYDSGEWVDWLDLALRNGRSTQHNISVSGGFQNTQYYISGGITDVQGLAVNDNYQRLTTRINLDTKVTDWLTIGTRTQLSYDDRSGISPTWDGDQGVFWMNPLTKAYDDNGDLTIYPWPDDPYFRNPLMGTLAKNNNESYQAVTNNYAIIDFPFIKGLQYRINTGIRVRFLDTGTYYGRDTQVGLNNRGDASVNRARYNNNVIENIVNYNREFGKHNVFFTGVYSFEETKGSSNELDASGFPHDILTWYSAAQAELIVPDFSYNSTALISQMMRLNYSYDSRYLLTLTGRRDGYSGFGANNKWGVFPSLALGWNISNENFFTIKDVLNQLKLRASYGLNGNQAVGAYETISRLSANNIVAGASTLPGYRPSRLGEDNLGWESTKNLNFGLDFGFLSNRIVGDMNYYKSNTYDLLLGRTISSVHGITSITQNIGETENTGFEASVTSRNIVSKNFRWVTSANASAVKNKIVSLYGDLDEEGNEIDDIANQWFIGQPIRVNFGYVWDGVWQLDEADEAALYGTQPGFIKIKDLDGDTAITADDRKIIGQRDPKFMWGMNNSWTWKNLTLSVFMHGVHGITKNNVLKSDNVYGGVRRNTTKKNWWTPENPTNEWYMNNDDAHRMQGVGANNYEKADFVRIKDITLSYDLAKDLLKNVGFDKLQIYFTGRNLITFTSWEGLDPELDGQRSIPLQKEYVFGLNLGF
jgi:TonB-linked SusC/RagA family outer membrane protein